MIDYQVQVYDDRTEWRLDGQLHRLDGPAIEYASGIKGWYLNGKCHRTDGPAMEGAAGDKWWYEDGQLHRLDGPAIQWADGTNCWYLNGESLTEAAHALAVAPKPTCAGKTVEIDGVKYVLTAV